MVLDDRHAFAQIPEIKSRIQMASVEFGDLHPDQPICKNKPVDLG